MGLLLSHSLTPQATPTLCQVQQVHRTCGLLLSSQKQSDLIFRRHSVLRARLQPQQTDQNRISGHRAGSPGTQPLSQLAVGQWVFPRGSEITPNQAGTETSALWRWLLHALCMDHMCFYSPLKLHKKAGHGGAFPSPLPAPPQHAGAEAEGAL